MNIEAVVSSFSPDINVQVSGRVKLVRSFGKLSFLTLEDATGKIQIGIRGKVVLPDLWDIISVNGTTGFTKTGERTIWTTSYELVAKCEGNISNKYQGVVDKGLIYNNRCLSLISNPDLLKILIKRSQIVQEIRTLLYSKGFIEIETPILSVSPTGASAEPFVTYHNSDKSNKYLRIATEVSLKKALISGVEKVFEIGKIFRNEGSDWKHHPEFTSIEIYQAYAGLKEMKQLVCEIVGKNDIPSIEYDELVKKYGEDFDEHLQELCFVEGQPIEQTPLCKKRLDGKAERFELFANGFEIANAFNEINTFKEQAERVKEGEDDGLLNALKFGMPPTGGVGIGIDRLLMYKLGVKNIKDIIFFA
jgi:lysyl-tRNA synthetase class 2